MAKTVNEMFSDLLTHLVEYGQWAGNKNVACHCHPEYVSCCPNCDNTEDEGHKPDCSILSLISEARGYLIVENKLAEEKDEDTVFIP